MSDQRGDLPAGEGRSGGGKGGDKGGDASAPEGARAVKGIISAPQVLGVIAGFAMQHIRRLGRTSHIITAVVLVGLGVALYLGPDETWYRGLLGIGAVVALVVWAVTQAQLWLARKAVHKVATPVQVLKPDEAADALAGALGLPGLTPWPLVKLIIRWVRKPEQRQTELAVVTERLQHMRRNPAELAMLFTAVPE